MWPKVRLGEILKRSNEMVEIRSDVEYREITVKLWGKGVVLRDIVKGAEIAAGRRYLARCGQLILSRIDARNGALGIIGKDLDAAVVSNDFPLYNIARNKLLTDYLGWICKTASFVEECRRSSEGTTNRVRIQENTFLDIEIDLPPLAEQRRIVSRIEELAAQINEARALRHKQEQEIRQMLLSAFQRVINGAPRLPMIEVAPLVRRPVQIDLFDLYFELGIRSFGKGTFHKPAITGTELGNKRVFHIQPGDLVFNNVFAWEGAITVAKQEDAGRVGSHRFITCVPKPDTATSNFLCFYFLTNEGIELIRNASPGAAGRNRTLGLAALDSIKVPVPSIDNQGWFDTLQSQVDTLKRFQAVAATELDALLPSILDRAFKGEL